MASFLRYRTVLAAMLAVMAATADASFQASDWQLATATFYGDSSGVSDDMGGACGYSDMYGIGFGYYTAALSTPLFNDGKGCGSLKNFRTETGAKAQAGTKRGSAPGCGGCYEIRCHGSPYCKYGASSITVTGTYKPVYPPNWAQDSNNGGWCNPPRVHFDMAMPAWLSIGVYEGGIIPVMYRRVPCQRSGGIKFKLNGNAYWLLLYIHNVGGSGDVSGLWVKGENTDWITMSQNFGIAWQAFSQLGGEALSFQVQGGSSSDTIICNYVTDAYWSAGLTYQAQNNFY